MTMKMKKKIIIFAIIAATLVTGAAFGYAATHVRMRDLFFREKFVQLKDEERRMRAITISSSTGLVAPSTPASAVTAHILVYHSILPYYPSETKKQRDYDVEPETFQKQIRWMKDNGYHIVSFDALVARIRGGAALPDRPVVITLDDAWENQYEYAFPILKQEGVTATFFVFSNAIGHKHFFSWVELAELAAAGMTIGGHSKSHPFLFKIHDAAALDEEVSTSKNILEKHLGKPITIFAYPFGRYTDENIAAVKRAGYLAARGLIAGSAHTPDDLLHLKSFQITNDFTMFKRILKK